MSSINLVRQITIKTIKAQPPKGSISEPTMIVTLYGRCTEKKVGTSDFGDFIRFKGEFEAVNAESGESYRAGNMIVPGVLEGLLDSAITVDETNAVDFAVEIWVEPSERSNTGYTYNIKPLIEPEESDALGQLRQLAQQKASVAIEDKSAAKK